MMLVNCASEVNKDAEKKDVCLGNICLEDNYDINIMPNLSRPIIVNIKFD